MTTILVTGASGFVGRHLVAELSRHNQGDIIGISSRPSPAIAGVRSLVCDLRDPDLIARVIDRYRPVVIYHLAGQAYVPQAFADPVATLTHNAIGQLNLFEACRKAEIDPVILLVSSAEVYGRIKPGELPVTEDQPFRPVNPYAVSKATQDLYGWQYYASYEMKIVRARPFNHAGPGQSDRFVLSSFARQVAEAEGGIADPVLLVGNLDAQRDFLDVRDVVRAYMLLAEERFAGEVFNVASGVARSIRELLDMLLAESNREITVRTDPSRMRPSDVPCIRGDTSKLREATGWEPAWSFERTVRDVLDEWRVKV